MIFSVKTLMVFFILPLALFTIAAQAKGSEALPYHTEASLPKIGTYVGYLVMDKSEWVQNFEGSYAHQINEDSRHKINVKLSPMKIAATLEVVRQDETEGGKDIPVLIAVLKLNLGGFHSTEYVTHFYRRPDYDWNNPIISFDRNVRGNSRDLSLYSARVSADGKYIGGKVRTAFGGRAKGSLELVYAAVDNLKQELDHMFPDHFVMPTITGNYKGNCGGESYLMQLEATKQLGFTAKSHNPFQGYQLSGRKGKLNAQGKYQKVVSFDNDGASYDFYNHVLKSKALRNKSCLVDFERIVCVFNDERGVEQVCQFNKTVLGNELSDAFSGVSYYQDKEDQKFKNAFRNLEEPPLDINATFSEVEADLTGFLHMEHRNVFEEMDIEVALTGIPDQDESLRGMDLSFETSLFVNGDSRLNNDFVTFGYEPQPISHAMKFITFYSHECEGVLAVERWTRNSMTGVVYSKSFGRVGRFNLARRGSEFHARLKDFHPTVAWQGGSYAQGNKFYQIDVGVLPADPEIEMVAPYYPFNLIGDIFRRDGILAGDRNFGSYHAEIITSHYDPFTGVFALKARYKNKPNLGSTVVIGQKRVNLDRGSSQIMVYDADFGGETFLDQHYFIPLQ